MSSDWTPAFTGQRIARQKVKRTQTSSSILTEKSFSNREAGPDKKLKDFPPHEHSTTLDALDVLSDEELDDFLKQSLALNKKLKEHLRDENMKEQGQMTYMAKNTLVLPPIVHKTSSLKNNLTTNR